MVKSSTYTYRITWYLTTCFSPRDKVLYLIYHAFNWLFSVDYMEEAGEDCNLVITFSVTVLGLVFTVNRFVVFDSIH